MTITHTHKRMTGVYSDCFGEAIAPKAQYNLKTITKGECEGFSGRPEPGRIKGKESSEMEQDHMILPHPPPGPLPAFCLWKTLKSKFNQRREKC